MLSNFVRCGRIAVTRSGSDASKETGGLYMRRLLTVCIALTAALAIVIGSGITFAGDQPASGTQGKIILAQAETADPEATPSPQAGGPGMMMQRPGMRMPYMGRMHPFGGCPCPCKGEGPYPMGMGMGPMGPGGRGMGGMGMGPGGEMHRMIMHMMKKDPKFAGKVIQLCGKMMEEMGKLLQEKGKEMAQGK
jgi:hypothetical protein